MTEAYPLWRELERASGNPDLLHEVGLACFGPKDGPYVAGLAAALDAQGVPYSRPNVDHAMPGLRLGPDEGLVFVPEAGWVRADAALQATHGLALRAGAEFVPTEAEGLDRFDRIVVCAGPWVRRFWPDAPVRVTLQATAFVVSDLAPSPWIEDGPDLLYGFPAFGPGSKIGVHRAGAEIDPDDPRRDPPEWMLDAIRSFARRRFGLDDPSIVGANGCPYTMTVGEGFLFHRPDDRTVVVSACSGHGFKFGPWVGLKVAAMVDGARA